MGTRTHHANVREVAFVFEKGNGPDVAKLEVRPCAVHRHIACAYSLERCLELLSLLGTEEEGGQRGQARGLYGASLPPHPPGRMGLGRVRDGARGAAASLLAAGTTLRPGRDGRRPSNAAPAPPRPLRVR